MTLAAVDRPDTLLPSTSAAPRISFVSLGCPKALVDSERIITRLRSEGYELAKTHGGADAVIVNTCGFLDSAKAESLAAIRAGLAENGKVIVTGCMGAQPEAVRSIHPDVLAITGPQQLDSVMDAVHAAVPPLQNPFVDLVPDIGIKLTPRHYAYLKISEGCNNSCSFCIIPQLRGRLVSRPLPDVMREAERLVKAGVKELLVISQDTGAYGIDTRYADTAWQDRAVRTKFIDLVRELGSLGAWVRLHYVYPYPHIDDVIGLMADGLVLPYLDMPLQHSAPDVLKAMRRPGDQMKMLDRIRSWRQAVPDLAIRSTFIVGFPGEADDDFRHLLDWIGDAKIDRLGAFQYEAVAGAPANGLGRPAIDPSVKQARFDRLMAKQQGISEKLARAKLGRRLPIIIDEVGPNGARGRSTADAPGIDGTVHVSSRRRLQSGDIVPVRIERAAAYDLYGQAV